MRTCGGRSRAGPLAENANSGADHVDRDVRARAFRSGAVRIGRYRVRGRGHKIRGDLATDTCPRAVLQQEPAFGLALDFFVAGFRTADDNPRGGRDAGTDTDDREADNHQHRDNAAQQAPAVIDGISVRQLSGLHTR